MATKPPVSAVMTLPKWMWNGAVDAFIKAARLRSIPDTGLDTDELRIETMERGSRERPGLVTVRQLSGPPLARADYDPLRVAEDALGPVRYLADRDLEMAQMRLDRVQETAEKGMAAGLIAPGLAFHQLQTMLADPRMSVETVRTVADDIRECRFASTDEQIFPTSGVFLVQHDPALLHRSKIPAVLLRIARDGKLQQADLEDIKAATQTGKSSLPHPTGLGTGLRTSTPI